MIYDKVMSSHRSRHDFKMNHRFVCNRKNEWQKHGVCAACVEGMNSPFRYFQICIKLRHQFDIHRLVHVHVRNTQTHTHTSKSVTVCACRLLEDAGITPSCDQAYKVTVFIVDTGGRYQLFPANYSVTSEVWRQYQNFLFACRCQRFTGSWLHIWATDMRSSV